MMPGMTGLDLARAVRAEWQICDVPIVLMSGAQAEIERNHPDLFQTVVNKPCDKEMVLTGIRGLMKNY
jgi:CheY-like chemotaxis protein